MDSLTEVNLCIDCSPVWCVVRRDGVPYDEALVAGHSGFGSQG